MKRLTAVAMALFLVTTVSATTSYDGPKDQPHIMGGDDDSPIEAPDIEDNITDKLNEKLDDNKTAEIQIQAKDKSKGIMKAIVSFLDSLL